MKLLCIIPIIFNMIFIVISDELNYSGTMMDAAWMPVYQDDGNVTIGYFNESDSEADESSPKTWLRPKPGDLKYILYTRSTRTEGTVIDIRRRNLERFDKFKPTKFITHGWMASRISKICIQIKDGFLDQYDANVFIMDWSKIAVNAMYFMPMRKTPDVGLWYSDFLNLLIEKHGADPTSFHLVGHSLGAHVSGFAARNVRRGKIGRVTGLDPARPGFECNKARGHLDRRDANFVDVIHTCAGSLGMRRYLGHADFYPNRGISPQPGCEKSLAEVFDACSHGRSWEFFVGSLKNGGSYKAYCCDSKLDPIYSENGCSRRPVYMGHSLSETARGSYCLKTN